VKKLFVTILAIGMVAGMASSAFAEPGPSAATGKGKNGTPASPTDRSAGQDNLLEPAGVPVFVGGGLNQDAPSGTLGVAVGDEGDENSVGRASISGDDGGIYVYAEDYTDGDQISTVVSTVDCTTTGVLLGCDGNDDDAVLVTISLA